MKDSMLLTILAGVFVFVISQFILKLILDPIVSFKKVFGEISALFLREQSSITNGTASNETMLEISRLSSMLLAEKQTIPFYSLFSKLLALPIESDLISGCKSLNYISYCVTADAPKMSSTSKNVTIVNKEMHKLEKYLNIRVTYK